MKSLTTTLFSILTISLSAQNFEFDSLNISVVGKKDETAFYKVNHLFNKTSDTLKMKWIYMSEEGSKSMKISMCDPASCNPTGVYEKEFDLDTHTTFGDYMNVHFYPNGQEGYKIVKLYVFETSDSLNGVTITFTGRTENYTIPTSLAQKQKNSELLGNNFPNPFKGQTTVKLSVSECKNPKIVVNDIIGNNVKTYNLNANQEELIVGNLKSGIYFYSLYDGNRLISTKKMTAY